jgi:N-methylhydantoinase B/oxoprolinase/acetone carboxylase alpha subunit
MAAIQETAEAAVRQHLKAVARTDPETYGNRNATRSLVYYALRANAMINEDIPLSQGCLAPTQIVIPESTVLSPSCGTAVYTGNSLTVQPARHRRRL